MAIENELKYVLPIEFNQNALTGWESIDIRQGYTQDNVPTIYEEMGRFFFSYRYGSNEQVKTPISKDDYDKLSRVAQHQNGKLFLKLGVRLRKENDEHLLTYKHLVAGDLIEIESKISKDIFDSLWPICNDIVEKTRFKKQIDQNEWVVDFLKDPKTSKTYFVQAEVEMPEGEDAPSIIPEEIRDHIIFEVPRNDMRFVNKNLANVENTRQLYASLVAK